MTTKLKVFAVLTAVSLLPVLFDAGADTKGAGQTPADKAATQTTPTQPSTTTQQSSKSPATRPAAKEFTDFCRQLEKTLKDGDTTFFGKHFDMDAVLDTALVCYDPKNDIHKTFRQNIKLDFGPKFSLQISALIKAGSDYSFLRAFEREGNTIGLFRLSADDGLNYHEYILARDKDANIRINDIFIYLSGEPLSKTIRQIWVTILALDEHGKIKPNTPDSIKELAEATSHLASIMSLIKTGKNQEALNKIQALPESVRNKKLVLIIRLLAAKSIGDKEYAEAMDTCSKFFGSDPSMNLLLIDHYIFAKQYDKAIDSINRLDAALYGDPYLNLARAGVFVDQGQPTLARETLKKAIMTDPTIVNIYWTLIGIELVEKNFKEVAALLTKLEKELGEGIGKLDEIPEYKEFVASPEYTGWMKTRKTASQPASMKTDN
ncbi:MAG: hypothetical protein HZA50_13560 [Planctomycetes bacterium]|nr:hypothetical protein [Planctomycetota bacterium]